jgi:cytochrome b pre-mRNA-processing protein 3
MNIEYLLIYNNLIKLTTNKSLYSGLKNNQDTFSDRLTFFLFHFAFILIVFKKKNENKKKLQELYDFNFRQLELTIREIGYGDQSINKKMKDYINVFHNIISEIHFWNSMDLRKKKEILAKFLPDFDNIDFLVKYFEEFFENINKFDLNSYLKSVKKL